MSERDDSRPAFPSPFIGNYGMTLRDYFAGKAMQGLFAGSYNNRVVCAADAKEWAEAAYAHADAMLKERAK